MSKIQFDMPADLHLAIKKIQLEKETMSGEKMSLKDIYFEVIRLGIDQYEKNKKG